MAQQIIGIRDGKLVDIPEHVYLKEQLLGFARDHRKKCDGASCSLSLYALLILAKRAGIEFNGNEAVEFL